MLRKNQILAAAAMLAMAGVSFGATVDGTADASYGPALVVQNTQTQFGDSNLGQLRFANGSELDQGFAKVESGMLYITLAGNLESNFNKLDVFIDSVAGGQNKLRGDNANVDFNGLNRMGDDGSGNGLTFDAGFEADYWISSTGGDVGGGNYGYFVNSAQLLTAGGGSGDYRGTNDGSGAALAGGNNPDGILAAINNSNTAGVDSGTGASSGAGVTTGMEFGIPLSVLGNPTGIIKISAFINGGGHDFLSNQFLGGVIQANLGEPRNANLANIAGDQFFSVAVPEPTGLAALGLAAAGLIARRRK